MKNALIGGAIVRKINHLCGVPLKGFSNAKAALYSVLVQSHSYLEPIKTNFSLFIGYKIGIQMKLLLISPFPDGWSSELVIFKYRQFRATIHFCN